jgi:peptidoglycan DL-endopeptidase CwlO
MARRMRRLALLAGVVAIPLVVWAVLPLSSSGSPQGRAARLQDKIEAKRGAIEHKKGRERVLSSDIAAYSSRIRALEGDIDVLRSRQARIEADLAAKRAELERLQARLRAERERLQRLRARLVEARTTLAGRLVAMYKADRPDVVTVVLESDGFADLLQRTEFMRRVSRQDTRIMAIVKAAKAEALATARRLARLEDRQQKVTLAVERRRNEVAAIKGELVDRRASFSAVRTTRREALASTRDSRQHLEGDLAALEKEQAKVQAALQRAAGSGPVRQGSGSLIWPVNGAIVSPFGQRWGRLHAGVDIAAPAGTPIRAADSGKVVLLGWTGGYGNYTCVQHNASLSTCYAHQSSYATSSGASVSKGQVIGRVGCTGHCFGDHLHFETRVGGAPVNPAGYL